MTRHKVLIVDDHPMMRAGLRATLDLEGDMDVVAEAESAEAALREATATQPDVVLMDVRMPGADGIQACQALRDQVPKAKVVMASIVAGAAGYLLKNTGRAELLRGIRAVAAGESLLDPSVTAQVLKRLKELDEKERQRDAEMLSPREREVLTLVAAGRTNKEVAAQLVITENTARNHVSRILDKIGASNRTEAAIIAAKLGLLDDRLPM